MEVATAVETTMCDDEVLLLPSRSLRSRGSKAWPVFCAFGLVAGGIGGKAVWNRVSFAGNSEPPVASTAWSVGLQDAGAFDEVSSGPDAGAFDEVSSGPDAGAFDEIEGDHGHDGEGEEGEREITLSNGIVLHLDKVGNSWRLRDEQAAIQAANAEMARYNAEHVNISFGSGFNWHLDEQVEAIAQEANANAAALADAALGVAVGKYAASTVPPVMVVTASDWDCSTLEAHEKFECEKKHMKYRFGQGTENGEVSSEGAGDGEEEGDCVWNESPGEKPVNQLDGYDHFDDHDDTRELAKEKCSELEGECKSVMCDGEFCHLMGEGPSVFETGDSLVTYKPTKACFHEPVAK